MGSCRLCCATINQCAKRGRIQRIQLRLLKSPANKKHSLNMEKLPYIVSLSLFCNLLKKINPHQVEPARSDRSLCQKKSKKDPCVFEGNKIEKGHLRIGSLNEEHDTFSWYVHLEVRRRIGAECLSCLRLFPFSRNSFWFLQCWRVQERIWLSFEGSEERSKIENSLLTLMSGYADLTVLQKQVQHISTDLSIFEVHCGIFRW